MGSLSITGIVDPIRLNQNTLKLGLGKEDELEHYTNNIKRKDMEPQVQLTEDQLQEKLEKETQLKEMNKIFYCQLCNKQYKKVQDYETHLGTKRLPAPSHQYSLDSYDHNHKKRFQEMKMLDKSRNPAKKDQPDKQLLHAMSLANKAHSKTTPTPPPLPPQPPSTTGPSSDGSEALQPTVAQPSDLPIVSTLPELPPVTSETAPPSTQPAVKFSLTFAQNKRLKK